MTTRYRVALQGFSDFERDALTSGFRLIGTRQPGYRLVAAMAGCDFIVADADHRRVREAIVASGRVDETVFVGDEGPDGAPALLSRPVDAQRLLDELDRLVARVAPQRLAAPGVGEVIELEAGGTAEAAPAAVLAVEAAAQPISDALPGPATDAGVPPAAAPATAVAARPPRLPAPPGDDEFALPLLDDPQPHGHALPLPSVATRRRAVDFVDTTRPMGLDEADAADTVPMDLAGPEAEDDEDLADAGPPQGPGLRTGLAPAPRAGVIAIDLPALPESLVLPDAALERETPRAPPEAVEAASSGTAPVSVLPPDDVDFPTLVFELPDEALLESPQGQRPGGAAAAAAEPQASATGEALPAASDLPLDPAAHEEDRARRAEAKAAARAAARRARLQAAGLPDDDGVVDVLVLDDSEIARRHLGGLLEAFGFNVHAFARSEAALRELARRPFAAVFLDLVLSEQDSTDGLELCRRLALGELPTAGAERPKLLMVTGQAAASDRVRAKLAGCDAFLDKPLTRGDVARALEGCRVRLPSDARRY